MERSDRKVILRKITEVEQQIARLRKEQEEKAKRANHRRCDTGDGGGTITNPVNGTQEPP